MQRGKRPGAIGHPLFYVWRGMKARCTIPRHCRYKYYGARGVKVCEQWLNFWQFVQDVGPRPSMKHTLDRYPDTKGNYEPGNVRWATWTEQLRNHGRNRLITHQGKTLCVSEWAELTGINKFTLVDRLDRGWSAERALTVPVRRLRVRSLSTTR